MNRAHDRLKQAKNDLWASEFMDIRDLAASADILVYTPAEFRELLKQETGFWKSVKETMQRIL